MVGPGRALDLDGGRHLVGDDPVAAELPDRACQQLPELLLDQSLPPPCGGRSYVPSRTRSMMSSSSVGSKGLVTYSATPAS